MIRTLVVDDDYRVADLHCAYVERVSGFAVAGRAHTGAEALSSVDQLRPDLVWRCCSSCAKTTILRST
jgi:response regulator of citrate/malate metabolism